MAKEHPIDKFCRKVGEPTGRILAVISQFLLFPLFFVIVILSNIIDGFRKQWDRK